MGSVGGITLRKGNSREWGLGWLKFVSCCECCVLVNFSIMQHESVATFKGTMSNMKNNMIF